ncbi:MAG: hypothetical protein ACE5GN_03130, partial [Waddliaceae bacterium]
PKGLTPFLEKNLEGISGPEESEALSQIIYSNTQWKSTKKSGVGRGSLHIRPRRCVCVKQN